MSETVAELKQKLATMTHVAKELHGVITEYEQMPCKSLMQRMFSTARRYKQRIFNDDSVN